MSEEKVDNTTKTPAAEKTPAHIPPKGVHHEFELKSSVRNLKYAVDADWMVLRKDEEPTAEMFFTAYIEKDADRSKRPITFVFNGGPGAASAYLHVGALGPKRVHIEDNGSLPAPPVHLVDNKDSWLEFTDLVFIDPIGTGFSRVIKKKDATSGKGETPPKSDHDPKEYFAVNRDLDSLGEFIQRCMTRYGRWASPVFIAGESYGGFRVAKLARRLQEKFGVGLSGSILISPALEIALLSGSDYDIHMWVDVFPSFVASAWTHKLGRFAQGKHTLEQALEMGERFATGPLAKWLLSGSAVSDSEVEQLCAEHAELSGLDPAYIKLKSGRIAHMDYVRQVLRKERKICGLYDSSVTLTDPFPDRDTHQGPEPTLTAIDRVFNSGVNSLLRDWLKVETDREYKLLSIEVNSSWKIDETRHAFDGPIGATDDLRYGMALNPHMKVFLTHGYFDLITPYFASKRIGNLLKLTDAQKTQLHMEHYAGGHMFYSWKESREKFVSSIRHFVASALKA